MRGIAFLAAATLMTPAAIAADSQSPLHLFKNWIVGCDNGRVCAAAAQWPEGESGTFNVMVERGPLPGDQPVIYFHDDGKYNPVDFSLDGKPLGLKLVAMDESNIRVAPESTAKAFAALLSPGVVKTIVTKDGEAMVVQTSGASAALRWLDGAQKREGTVTAIVAKGAKPASAVPPPPALPSVTRRMPKGLAKPDTLSAAETSKWRNEIFECEDEPSESGEDKVEYRRLDAKTTLAAITASCASGAYNYLYIPLLLRTGQKAQLAKFEGDEGSEPGDGLYNLYWKDEDDRVLASYMKGRGIGDCGGGTDYVWDGAMFRIVGASQMDDCRGAQGWITTFRARIVDK